MAVRCGAASRRRRTSNDRAIHAFTVVAGGARPRCRRSRRDALQRELDRILVQAQADVACDEQQDGASVDAVDRAGLQVPATARVPATAVDQVRLLQAVVQRLPHPAAIRGTRRGRRRPRVVARLANLAAASGCGGLPCEGADCADRPVARVRSVVLGESSGEPRASGEHRGDDRRHRPLRSRGRAGEKSSKP